MSLRSRCTEMYHKMSADAMLRQGSPVEDLMAFVIAETGRSADERLEDTHPLCVYFGNKEDREEFLAVMREAKPGMMMKNLP